MPARTSVPAHARPPSRRPLAVSLLAALAVLAAAIAGISLTVSSASAAAGRTVRAVAQAAPPAASAAAGGAASSAGQDKAVLARAALAVIQARAAAAAALIYTVRPGDTMTGIALSRCAGAARDWTGIYAASRARGWTAWNADDIAAGQHLFLACSYVPGMLGRAYVPSPVVQLTASVIPASSHPAYSPGSPAASYQAPVYHGSGSMQSCIIARESGGNSQVMNATGHYGLYQFSAGTWAAHGGNPADFGRASVAEQNAVFQSTVAADGYSDWAPYDGC